MSLDSRKAASTHPPYLLGLTGPLNGRELILRSPRHVLGRDSAKCDLVLDHTMISREHLILEVDGYGHVTITDAGSSQGTFVNGERISTRRLEHGDRVGLGGEGILAFTFHSLVVAKPADPKTLRIGRAPDNDVVLESPGVSRYHAVLRYDSAGHATIVDCGSTNGTFVNGWLVREPVGLAQADLVFVGGFLLKIDGGTIITHDLGSSRLIAAGIGKQYAGRVILQDISFAILPREFIGLMGPSGCGKSTLMDALNGLRPASSGAVFINNLDLYKNFNAIRRSIGYVPQRDILHDALSVERTLFYSAKLRLPEHTTPEEMRCVIDEVIATVGLQDQRSLAFHQLSGGQQKRLSVGLELITKPSFLFLDEPTSPLDPEASKNLMLLFRKLADQGRIVVMVTHKFEQFDQMHQVALLTTGGRLAYFGPPREALRYFKCQEPGEIYHKVASKDPEQVRRAFVGSPQYQQHVTARLAESQEAISDAQRVGGLTTNESRAPHTRFGLQQWLVLTRRYLEIKLKDRRNTALLIVQAPIIALILAFIAGDTPNDAKTLFIIAVIAVWFGANNAIREIVAETPIYKRERLINLRIPSYLFSKFTVLAGVAVVQCTLLLAVLIGLNSLRAADAVWLLVSLSLTAFGGIGMGLLFSAIVNSAEKAMSVLPLILIPQLLLSGFLKPVDDVYVNPQTATPATVEQYEAFQAASAQPSSALRSARPVAPVSKMAGLGVGKYASALMIARWSVDALAHTVSRSDSVVRDRLAAQISVPAYSHVLAGEPEDAIVSAFERQAMLDWVFLLLSAALCLCLTGWALKSKDAL